MSKTIYMVGHGWMFPDRLINVAGHTVTTYVRDDTMYDGRDTALLVENVPMHHSGAVLETHVESGDMAQHLLVTTMDTFQDARSSSGWDAGAGWLDLSNGVRLHAAITPDTYFGFTATKHPQTLDIILTSCAAHFPGDALDLHWCACRSVTDTTELAAHLLLVGVNGYTMP